MEEVDIQTITEDLEFLASERDGRMVLNILVGNHPADIAKIIQGLSEENQFYVFELLDADTAADVLMEFDDVTRERMVADIEDDRLTALVDKMASDDATDLVAELPKEIADKVLRSIDKVGSAEVKALLRHEEDTAGGIMAMEFVSVLENETVGEAIRKIRTKAEEVNQVYNVYVVDADGVLVGVLPLKKLLLAKGNQKVRDLMNADVISVPTDMDQEEVANFFRRYDLVSMPVINHTGMLVGRITVDDVVDVLKEEASEDMQRMAGITDEEEIRETSAFKISFGRLPWLVVGLVGQLAAAIVLAQFEATLEQIVMATFFIPLMMAMGGNCGIQAATIMVRGIALGELDSTVTLKRLGKEVQVSMFNAIVCGVLLFAIISGFGSPGFGFVLSLALIAVILNASFIGASIPLILRKVGIDPAIATGPLITTFNDIIGLFIYLGLVTAAIQYL